MAVGEDILQARAARLAGGKPLSSLVSVGVLSFGALETISRALALHRESGLIDCAGEFFVHFNAMTDADKDIAEAAGVRYFGAADNRGIYGGFRAIAERAANPYVLILENDVVPLPGAEICACLDLCVADMIEHGVKAFSLRSRREPGEGRPYAKYIKTFGLIDPVSSALAPKKAAPFSQARMFLEHGSIDKFRAASLFCEREPEKVQASAIRKLPSGNYLTDSRYRNWSNQAVLVERRYFLDVVCRRVEEHPDPRLVNGRQDIERALNRRWWRRRRDPMGQAAEGVFTHRRLDR